MKKIAPWALVGLASIVTAQLNFTFDSDNEGWRRSDFNATTFQLTDVGAATWNPNGYLDETDFSSWAFLTRTINADLSGSLFLEFDYAANATDPVAYPLVVIASATEAIFQEQIPIADGGFYNYRYDLTTANTWQYANIFGFRAATVTDINRILGNVAIIGVNADTLSGDDLTQLDNVRTAVPEPATLAVLGLGAVALLRRRKN